MTQDELNDDFEKLAALPRPKPDMTEFKLRSLTCKIEGLALTDKRLRRCLDEVHESHARGESFESFKERRRLRRKREDFWDNILYYSSLALAYTWWPILVLLAWHFNWFNCSTWR